MIDHHHHIDLSSVLRRTVCDLYSDLVTRSTGAAVRSGIERQLAELGRRTLTVIDFSHVGLLDFSCADEIVAKLLLRETRGEAPREAYFLLRGLSDSHVEAIEAVLAHHGLAIVAQAEDSGTMLVGQVPSEERQVWDAAARLGRANAGEVAREAGVPESEAAAHLQSLWTRGLLMRFGEWYVALGATSA